MTVRLTLIAPARSSSLLDTRFDDDRPLDATGCREAERAAPTLVHLAAAEWRFRSPSTRCRETGDFLGLSPMAQPALCDWDMGRWRGYTLEEVMAAEPDAVNVWLSEPRAAPHGGETLISFVARIGRWLDSRPEQQESRMLAVAEPGVIRAAVTYALGAPPHSFWRIDVAPLSSVELSGRAGRWNLRPSAPWLAG